MINGRDPYPDDGYHPSAIGCGFLAVLFVLAVVLVLFVIVLYASLDAP